MAATIAVAVFGPTPLIVAMRWQRSLLAENRIDLLVEDRDAAVEVSEEIIEFSDCLPRESASVRSPGPTGSPEPTAGRG